MERRVGIQGGPGCLSEGCGTYSLNVVTDRDLLIPSSLVSVFQRTLGVYFSPEHPFTC